MSEIQEIRMSYEGLVEAGREARKQIDDYQWTEGELALQVETLPQGQGPRDPETGDFIEDEVKALKRYADDIDISYPAIQKYRRTAEAWPSSSREKDASYKVHEILSAQDDRLDLIQPGMSTREAHRLIRKRSLATQHEPGWFELLGEVADHLIKADRQLDKVEDAITRKPNEKFIDQAKGYAERADEIAERLRGLGAA